MAILRSKLRTGLSLQLIKMRSTIIYGKKPVLYNCVLKGEIFGLQTNASAYFDNIIFIQFEIRFSVNVKCGVVNELAFVVNEIR